MTTLTIGEAATMALGQMRAGPSMRRKPHRTGAPVRRGSIEAGTFEESFFAVPIKGEPDRLVRLVRAALDAGRRAKRCARIEARTLTATERAIAGLTAGAVRVFEELCMLARVNKGRVFPSYDHLARATALGRATVARSLAALEAAGFLVRQRRFARVEGEGAGPRYAQTSNVYRPVLPKRVLALLPHWLRPPPLPADTIQHEADRRAEQDAMLATLSCRDLAWATVNGPLGRMLAKLGTAIDCIERESHSNPQPLFNLFKKNHQNQESDKAERISISANAEAPATSAQCSLRVSSGGRSKTNEDRYPQNRSGLTSPCRHVEKSA